MKKLLLYYNFIVISLLVLSSFLNTSTPTQLASSIIFFPLFAYFALSISPSHSKSIKLSIPVPTPSKTNHKKSSPPPLEATPITKNVDFSDLQETFDSDRRSFIKLIGSAGISMFIFAMFTKRAEAAFFGSVPGPGTLALKDTAGNKIDPAEKQPTDGYRVSEIDDSTSTAYYGFINKSGAWFIQREDSAGAHRYTKGASDFSTNWTNRASLTYDYFDSVF